MSEILMDSSATTKERLDNIFQNLQKNRFNVAAFSVKQRRQKLKDLYKAILKYRGQIKEALYLDFRKHPFEVDLTEIYTVTGEIKHARKHLRRWMGKHAVSTPIALFGSRSYIQYEPKGTVLIISPWNFPVTLTLGPLVTAIAAGNTVVLKPSEQTPNATYIMQKIIAEVFTNDEVVLIPGGIETSKMLLALPFDHIFFTGSSRVGKIVMEAAAKHLASVTLELGGKSPTIVDETADINQAARRIIWAKCINNGQICIAPDHVWVHEKVAQKFLKAVEQYLIQFYGPDVQSAPSYARLINTSHFNRLEGFINNALNQGASLEVGGKVNEAEKFIEPTVLTNASDQTEIMQEEIFGPILPIITFRSIPELIDLLNQKEKPLATYIYSGSRKNINQIIKGTRSGGSCINHSGIHFFNNDLPFGGSNHSGLGKGHGWFGFHSFSNPKAVYHQVIPNALELLVPPYNNLKQKILNFTIKYL